MRANAYCDPHDFHKPIEFHIIIAKFQSFKSNNDDGRIFTVELDSEHLQKGKRRFEEIAR